MIAVCLSGFNYPERGNDQIFFVCPQYNLCVALVQEITLSNTPTSAGKIEEREEEKEFSWKLKHEILGVIKWLYPITNKPVVMIKYTPNTKYTSHPCLMITPIVRCG